jgi:hypothetical protein
VVRRSPFKEERSSIHRLNFQDRHLRGRPTGGIYLLGTKHARSILTTQPTITSCSITFSTATLRMSGVYFPPALISIHDVKSNLKTLHNSSIIIGDVNVRLRNSIFWEGAAGPAGRQTGASDQQLEGCEAHYL